MADFSSYRLYEQGAGSSRRRIVELITRAKGERMVRSATARAGLDWDGKTLCFERIDTSAASVVPAFVVANMPAPMEQDLSADISNPAFAKAEVQAIAGRWFKHGRSRTARMTDEQRANRKGRYGMPLPPVDLVERAVNKYEGYKLLGPALQELVREVACL